MTSILKTVAELKRLQQNLDLLRGAPRMTEQRLTTLENTVDSLLSALIVHFDSLMEDDEYEDEDEYEDGTGPRPWLLLKCFGGLVHGASWQTVADTPVTVMIHTPDEVPLAKVTIHSQISRIEADQLAEFFGDLTRKLYEMENPEEEDED